MKTAHVCFLWHMHQPYYTDPVSGLASMPWVRLHAIKAYYDMAYMMERFPAVRGTFNFTPSLLIQLKEMGNGAVRDLFLEYAQKPAAALSPEERAFIVRHFFAANWATMVRPYPRYHELLVKRGGDVGPQTLDRLARQYSTQELLDLQVWHNLAWFGFGCVARHPRLQDLRSKDRGFTEEEKQEVLTLQRRTIGEIIPFYRRLAESGQIELTTTPFYHPILPLIIDSDFAKRSRPEAALPQRYQAPADAEAQLQKSAALHTELFGHPPAGLWPSEGSVCPEMVPMVARTGFQWMATDEGNLARSLGHWDRMTDLYRPYRVGPPGEDVSIIFRDREISDAFGFVYAKWAPDSAAEDVVRRLEGIARQAPHEQTLIPIILDGENPWEYYYDGGQQFLTSLYSKLAKPSLALGPDLALTTNTVHRYLTNHPAGTRLEHLHSGSWINQDFKIWIGHPEDNRGWELLRHTRARLTEIADQLPPEQAKAAWEELYAAEGSDWFWWYGDDFETDYKSEFDRLFRLHLQNVFTRAGLAPPAILSEPVIGMQEADRTKLPATLLSPTLDGVVTDFFEWYGAGTIDPAPPLGAMWRSDKFFRYIGFGFSLDDFYLRLDPEDLLPTGDGDLGVELHILTPSRSHKLTFPLSGSGGTQYTLWSATPGQAFAEAGSHADFRRRSVIELGISFKAIDLQAGQPFKISVLVTQQGSEVARYPRFHPVALTVPDRHYDAVMWKV
ncbi:MAG: glycoside hydrolase [Nitrospira sp.]|nr:MAG: glycoside hydrolase [Nitrospira sp.]